MNKEFVPDDSRPLSGLPSVIRVGGIARLKSVVADLPLQGPEAAVKEWSIRLRDALRHLRDLRLEHPLEHEEAQELIRSALQVLTFQRDVYAELRVLFREVLEACQQTREVAESLEARHEADQRQEGIQRMFRKCGASQLAELAAGRFRGSKDEYFREALRNIKQAPMSQAPDPADALIAEQAVRSMFVQTPEFCESHAAELLAILARLRLPVDQVAHMEKDFGRAF